MRKSLATLAAIMIATLGIAACSDADVASRNLSKAADNFEVNRRIVFYKKPGDFVTAGERIGLIKFGSRVDISFGPEWQLEVAEGQRVAGGSSILARRKSQ